MVRAGPGGAWRGRRRRAAAILVVALGLAAVACKPVAFDYTGDKKADLVWSTVDGRGTSTTTDDVRRWYQGTDPTPVAAVLPATGAPLDGDYDGDGRWEPAVVGADGTWTTAGGAGTFSFPPPTGCSWDITYGEPPLVPLVGDWDGDGTTDPGWFCSPDATWHLPGQAPIAFGSPADAQRPWDHDVPAAADYRDGKATELAVYRPTDGTWWVRGDAAPLATGLGLGIPLPAPYDDVVGADPAVYSVLEGTFDRGAAGVVDGPGADEVRSGAALGYPAPSDLDGDGTAELVVLLDGEAPSAPSVIAVDDGTRLVLGDTGSTWGALPSAGGSPMITGYLRATFHERSCSPDHPQYRYYCVRPAVAGDHDGERIAGPTWVALDGSRWGVPPSSVAAGPLPCSAPGPCDHLPVDGDYDGDGSWEHAVVDLDTGEWATAGLRTTSTPTGTTITWATSDVSLPPPACAAPSGALSTVRAVPVPGRYASLRRTDPAWYCPVTGSWHFADGSTLAFGTAYPASPGWLPVGHPTTGHWYDLPAPGDYDGDGLDEPAVYRPIDGTIRTADGTVVAAGLGVGLPIPADYDGDGQTDGAAWSPLDGTWRLDGGTVLGPIVTPGPPASPLGLPGAADHDGDGAAEPSTVVPVVGQPGVTGRFLVLGTAPRDITTPDLGTAAPATTPASAILHRDLVLALAQACVDEGACAPVPAP